MMDFIAWLTLIIGIVIIVLPQKWFKRLNTPMIGLTICCLSLGYIVVIGTKVSIINVIDFVKGWFIN